MSWYLLGQAKVQFSEVSYENSISFTLEQDLVLNYKYVYC